MRRSRSFKAQLLTLCISVYVFLWGLFLAVATYSFSTNLGQVFADQHKWLSLYATTLVGDIRVGNMLAAKHKLRTLVENDVFTNVYLSSGGIEQHEEREIKSGEATASWLDFLLSGTRLQVEIRDEYNTSWGTLEARLDPRFLLAPLERSLALYGRMGIALFFLFLGLLILLIQRHSRPLERLTSYIAQFSASGATPETLKALVCKAPVFPVHELQLLVDRFRESITHLLELEERVRAQKVESELAKVAVQVAHDIRSPLAAIGMIAAMSADDAPSKYRETLRGAAAQIRAIANDLLSRYRATRGGGEVSSSPGPAAPAAGKTAPELIVRLLESAVTTVQVQHGDKSHIRWVMDCDPKSAWSFALVDGAIFQRVISNLLQNAVEAAGRRGEIRLSLKAQGVRLRLDVSDTGRGMSPEVIARVLSGDAATEKAQGHGLGLSHAVSTVRAWGGEISLASEPGKGTTVTLDLPRAAPPAGLVEKLSLEGKGAVVVLDDDELIHTVWEHRLRGVPGFGLDRLRAFSSPAAMNDWMQKYPREAAGARFLVDYELSRTGPTGLDVVEEVAIAGRAILVTGRDWDEGIRERALDMGVGILPKVMMKWVPIHL